MEFQNKLIDFVEDNKWKNEPWLSVPQFGDWDQKGQVPDYSLDFSKIREMRKQKKRDVSRVGLGNEEELVSSTASTFQLQGEAFSATLTAVRKHEVFETVINV